MASRRIKIDPKQAERFVEERRKDARDFIKQQHGDAESLDAQDHLALMSPGGEIVQYYGDLLVVEHLRREALNGRDVQMQIPTDVFVFEEDEPADRTCTKFGGLPYYESSRLWPAPMGEPLAFIAQISFADSHDLVPDLPGDILLVFVNPSEMDEFGLHVEWSAMGDDKKLISLEEMPVDNRFVTPMFGWVCRTSDFPDAEEYFENYKRSYLLDVLQGTKIGGVPGWIQQPVDLPGQFLCSLGHSEGLDWGDAGSVYFFIDKLGTINATIQCY
jgi:uncharacterized protein YwqG